MHVCLKLSTLAGVFEKLYDFLLDFVRLWKKMLVGILWKIAQNIVWNRNMWVCRSSHTDFYSPKLFRSDLSKNISQSVMASMSSIIFKFQRSCWQIDIIMQNQAVLGIDIVKIHNRLYRSSWPIHKFHRFQRNILDSFKHSCCKLSLKFFVKQKIRSVIMFTKVFQCNKSCIVSCSSVLFSGISQPDKQFHH